MSPLPLILAGVAGHVERVPPSVGPHDERLESTRPGRANFDGSGQLFVGERAIPLRSDRNHSEQ